MATAIKSIDNFPVSNAAGVVYTVPDLTQSVFQKFIVTNLDSSSHTLTIYKVAPAGSPGATNIIVNVLGVSVGPVQEIVELQGITLEAGWILEAVADAANKVSLNASILEFS